MIFVAGLAPAWLYLLLRYTGASAFLPSEILGAAWAFLNLVVEAAAVGLVCSLIRDT
jgi:ABC-type polysaccharide/polyol phosphate export permease